MAMYGHTSYPPPYVPFPLIDHSYVPMQLPAEAQMSALLRKVEMVIAEMQRLDHKFDLILQRFGRLDRSMSRANPQIFSE